MLYKTSTASSLQQSGKIYLLFTYLLKSTTYERILQQVCRDLLPTFWWLVFQLSSLLTNWAAKDRW